MKRETLARYPYPVVRVACRYCKRRGRYRLESLVATYGPDTTFEELLTRLSADCARSSNRTNRPGCRGAYLPDLERKEALRRDSPTQVDHQCPFGFCIEDRRVNRVRGRKTDFRFKQSVSMACTFGSFMPGTDNDPDPS